mgnify:CR=1 FL=1
MWYYAVKITDFNIKFPTDLERNFLFMKLIKIKKNYTNKAGEQKTSWQFYVEFNGSYIRIEPYQYTEKQMTHKKILLTW